MRKSYSSQLRLDSLPIDQVPLNFDCRDRIVPVLRSLQHVYSKPEVIAKVMSAIGRDINGSTASNLGRNGMDYWHILVLASVRLGCDYTYDHLQELSENHIKLRAIMGIGSWDEDTEFKWQRIRDNVCQLTAETIDQISQIIVAEGHSIVPEAIENVRADSFVMETNIHYPTESSLIRDGLKKILAMCSELAFENNLAGWRQHRHLWKRVKLLARKIDRIAANKGPNYMARMQTPYRELLQKSRQIIERARELCVDLSLPEATENDVFGPHTLQAFIARTERVMDTARRRVLLGESVPNSDKLFSVFEPHTQLYKRGKAGSPIQFGRQVLVFEDAAGFIVQGSLMNRDQCDSEVAVNETKVLQERFDNRVRRLSFDRGFHSPENQDELAKLVANLCLPKPGAKQSVKQLATADEEFLVAKQNHPGVESAIGALQNGNGLQRCRDRSEIGFERYMSLAVLGRNLQTLGRLLITKENP
ncbi:MAG TPA: ISNCY family transposase, partial [Gammaproteobacteria bacterium]|nr:ISNCY family transposase [Gammaproteobacteria bacterium]